MSGAANGFELGEVIAGRYRILRLVGKGGMGAVFAARNEMSGREVALKVIHTSGEETEDQRRRFLREAKAATAIRHPSVIEVLDVFEEEGTLVMVMELLEGETLKAFRQREGAVTLHRAATILVPVLEALVVAHAKGVVHRDLKPDNVFLADKDGTVVPTVLDFGIAKVLDQGLTGETQGGATATGSLLGTPHYMSYEQAMSEKDIDQRADVWAVGVILFELLTGRRPIQFGNLGEMYTAFITGTVPSIRTCVPAIPSAVGATIDRCLAKERDARLEDLSPLLEELRPFVEAAAPGGDAGGEALAELPEGAPPPADPEVEASVAAVAKEMPAPRRSRTWLAAGGVVVAAAAIAAVIGFREAPEAELPEPAAPGEPSVEALAQQPGASEVAEPAPPAPSDEAPSASASVATVSSAKPVAVPRPPQPPRPRAAASVPPDPPPEPAPPPEKKSTGPLIEDPY